MIKVKAVSLTQNEYNITEMLAEAQQGYNQCALVSEEDNAALLSNTNLEVLGIPDVVVHELLRISWYLESVSELLDEQYEEDYPYLSVVDADEGIVRYNDIKITVE
ncbi:hypothetical protein Goe9_c02130 [Bacillus phage vB_BsuM-Goe9]|nr:hypothetical protein Goe9_c00130 [Bacillus phage vB_BsuM-Goe9]QMV48516.1 hypothetical protein Goe9_c02130 [Bacillus phage vB_BsuM-Goe9]